jgi:predicted phosphatase
MQWRVSKSSLKEPVKVISTSILLDIEEDEAFLWIHVPTHKSYVQWARQSDVALCRETWTNMKSPSNADGSQLVFTCVEAFVAAVKQYVDAAF